MHGVVSSAREYAHLRESGNLANRILCQLFLSITVHEDRSVTVNPSDWLKDWMDTDT